MNEILEIEKSATRLLDPRFNYVPAVETNIAATWMRFGFNPNANQERRERLKNARDPVVPALMNADENSPMVRGRLQFC